MNIILLVLIDYLIMHYLGINEMNVIVLTVVNIPLYLILDKISRVVLGSIHSQLNY